MSSAMIHSVLCFLFTTALAILGVLDLHINFWNIFSVPVVNNIRIISRIELNL